MKIEASKTIIIDGKRYNELSDEEMKNVWLRCVDYMRTHYDDGACRVVAALVSSYFGKWEKCKGYSIEI